MSTRYDRWRNETRSWSKTRDWSGGPLPKGPEHFFGPPQPVTHPTPDPELLKRWREHARPTFTINHDVRRRGYGAINRGTRVAAAALDAARTELWAKRLGYAWVITEDDHGFGPDGDAGRHACDHNDGDHEEYKRALEWDADHTTSYGVVILPPGIADDLNGYYQNGDYVSWQEIARREHVEAVWGVEVDDREPGGDYYLRDVAAELLDSVRRGKEQEIAEIVYGVARAMASAA